MKTNILSMLIVLSMLLIPIGSALEPTVTSYWGYVSDNGVLRSDAVITVHDDAGNEITNTISLDGSNRGLYQVTVPWDDTTTATAEGAAAGESITFKIDGKPAGSIMFVLDASKGIRLDLDVANFPSPTTSTPDKKTLGFGLIATIFVLMYLAIRIR